MGVPILSVRRVCDADFPEMTKWAHARGQNMPHRSLFPRNGFIIDGTAAGFVYFTDSAVAILDCYISNPSSEKKTRSDALDAITDALIRCAEFHRCKLIKCDTKIEAIKRRAERFEFVSIGAHESFCREL